MKINSENNNSAVLSELGARIKRNRIDMQLSQQDFAAKAGISTRTLSAAENGEDIRLSSLIRILRTLNCLENLNMLLPELSFDPEAYRVLGRGRKRVSRKSAVYINSKGEYVRVSIKPNGRINIKKGHLVKEKSETKKASQWKWGDEE